MGLPGLRESLALAQAADSVADSVTAVALLYSLRIGSAPADADHRGAGAEPAGRTHRALLAASWRAVLGVEVFRSHGRRSAGSRAGHSTSLTTPLALIFGLKVVAKTVITHLAG